MAGDPVDPVPGRLEASYRFCEACAIRVQLHHESCPRCRGPLATRNQYADVLASCRASEVRLAKREVRLPLVACLIALAGLAGGVAYGLARAPSVPGGEPLVLGRPRPRPSTTVRVRQDPAPDAAGFVALEPIPSEDESRRALLAGEVESALEGYRTILATRPRDLNALTNAGQALVKLGRAIEAVPLLEEAVRLAPRSWMVQFNLARAYGQTDRWDRAAGHYQAASVLMPDHFPTLFNLGLALQRDGRDQAAAGAFRRATEAADATPDAWLALGACAERLGEAADARHAYQRYIALAPDAPERATVEQHLARLGK